MAVCDANFYELWQFRLVFFVILRPKSIGYDRHKYNRDYC